MFIVLAQLDGGMPSWLIPFVLFVLTLIGFGITIGMFRQTVKSHTERILALEKKARAGRRSRDKLRIQLVVMEGAVRNVLRARSEDTAVLPNIDLIDDDDEDDDSDD